jgi:hypothetical protein
VDNKELAQQLKDKGVDARVGGGDKRFKVRTKTRVISLQKSKELDLDKLVAYLKK